MPTPRCAATPAAKLIGACEHMKYIAAIQSLICLLMLLGNLHNPELAAAWSIALCGYLVLWNTWMQRDNTA